MSTIFWHRFRFLKYCMLTLQYLFALEISILHRWTIFRRRDFISFFCLSLTSAPNKACAASQNSHFKSQMSVRIPHYFSCIFDCDKNRLRRGRHNSLPFERHTFCIWYWQSQTFLSSCWVPLHFPRNLWRWCVLGSVFLEAVLVSTMTLA